MESGYSVNILMQNFYFSFGSDESYPYPNRYLIVQAKTYKDAVKGFREKYPDRTEGIIHCAFIYTQEEWKGVCEGMRKQEPVEILIAD